MDGGFHHCASFIPTAQHQRAGVAVSVIRAHIEISTMQLLQYSCVSTAHLSCNSGLPWIPQINFCNKEKIVCVCIVLVHYGPFPQEINGKSVKLAV